MHRRIALAVVVAALAAAPAPAAVATTKPGVVYTIRVVLTDRKIAIQLDKLARNGTSRYPRGAVIHYAIRNGGTRAYAFKIWDRQTKPIPPGGRDHVLVNWNYRGIFSCWTVYRGKPAGPKDHIIVF